MFCLLYFFFFHFSSVSFTGRGEYKHQPGDISWPNAFICVHPLFFPNRKASFHKNMHVGWKDWASLSNLWKLVWSSFVQLKGIGTHLDIKLMKRNDKKESCFCELLFLFRLQPLALAWDTETIFRNKEAEYPSACPSSFSGRNFLIFLF